MTMRRIIYVIVLSVTLLSGCRYNPLYDGQQFRVYHQDCGLRADDGGHIYVPLKSDAPYVVELYGGMGRKHTVTIDNTDCLDYSYRKGSAKGDGFAEMDIKPAGVTLVPKQLGLSLLTVEDEHTGEAVSLAIHICEAYKAIEVSQTFNSLAEGTVLAFKYGGVDDKVKICKGSLYEGDIEYILEGRYAFVPYESTVALELTYPADENLQPSAGGAEVKKVYKVEFYYGPGTESPETMLLYMNLKDFPLQTKAFQYPEYYMDFRFVDITDGVYHDKESPAARYFYANSAVVIPWK